MLTYGTIQEATNTEAVTTFLEERILAGTDWNLVKVRKRTVRLDPPVSYWALYRVTLGTGDLVQPDASEDLDAEEQPEPQWSQQRELQMVARGVFDQERWSQYVRRLETNFGGRACDPLNGFGYPVAFPETQHVFWFYPVDAGLLTLPDCADQSRMLRLFRRLKRDLLDYPARIASVRVQSARYLPEITAIFRYQLETVPAAAGKTLYGKVQRAGRGAETNWLMQQIWTQATKSKGRLSVPKPLGYHSELDFFLQEAAPGNAITSDRLA